MDQQHEPAEGRNRLAAATSPYLLQHAEDPVDWFPWGEEAFARARAEQKPVFLSIGYSTCHWCHVMERESFQDPQVARLLNDGFVAIKVDREERPDVDRMYMAACQMLTGGGGWPLTLVLTPQKEPFFAATYIPRTSRFGRRGLLELLPRIRELWESRRDEVLDAAAQVTAALQRPASPEGEAELGRGTLDAAARQLEASHDARHGGFGSAPKFPTPHQLCFLLRWWERSGESPALAMVETTLQALRRGGVYDQVGFGFHRYATDARWRVPHFEKMLYDQALLAIAYTEAWQATADPLYRQTAGETFAYVLRELATPQGAFASAQDADTEGVEGLTYLWTPDQVREVLGAEEAELVCQLYGIREGGNFQAEAPGQPQGASIPYLAEPLEGAAERLGTDASPLRQRLEASRRKLLRARRQRPQPETDDKVVTAWNGLMVAALALGARAFEEPDYARAASRAADFLLGDLRDESGRLHRSSRRGVLSPAPAVADDYAFLAWGLLELYQATFQVPYLEAALGLADGMLERFWDSDGGGLFLSPADGEALLVRRKEAQDGALPSANSVALATLLRLGRLTGRAALEAKAAAIARAFAPEVRQAPVAYTHFLCGVDLALGPAHEIVVAGEPGAADTEALLRALATTYLPRATVVLRPPGPPEPPIVRLAPFARHHVPREGRATAYPCQAGACQQPASEPAALLDALRADPGRH
ncbi:MAG: thioredoxin domain-containing protein [Candidatus Brocadiia bacterium]